MDMDLKSQWSGAKKKNLSPGSSEWCRGGGRRGLCCAVGSSEKEKMKKIAFSRTRNKKDEKMVHFLKEGHLCLEGHYWKRQHIFWRCFSRLLREAEFTRLMTLPFSTHEQCKNIKPKLKAFAK
jgi:hypothetical protein